MAESWGVPHLHTTAPSPAPAQVQLSPDGVSPLLGMLWEDTSSAGVHPRSRSPPKTPKQCGATLSHPRYLACLHGGCQQGDSRCHSSGTGHSGQGPLSCASWERRGGNWGGGSRGPQTPPQDPCGATQRCPQMTPRTFPKHLQHEGAGTCGDATSCHPVRGHI